MALANLLRPSLQGTDTTFGPCVPVEKAVAVGILRLAHNMPYRLMEPFVGIAHPTCIKHFWRFLYAVIHHLGHMVQWPTGARMETVLQQFASRGLIGCMGAIDGTHIKIAAPMDANIEHYYCVRKGSATLNTQLTADLDGFITSCAIGFPGTTHDSRMLRCSSVYKEAHALFDGPGVQIPGTTELVSPYLLGDQGYPVMSWLVPVFSTRKGFDKLPAEQRRFNFVASGARACIERVNGMLKGRFTCLSTGLRHSNVALCSKIIFACICLHNWLMMMRDAMPTEELMHSARELLDKHQERLVNARPWRPPSSATMLADKRRGVAKRARVAAYLAEHADELRAMNALRRQQGVPYFAALVPRTHAAN